MHGDEQGGGAKTLPQFPAGITGQLELTFIEAKAEMERAWERI